MILSKLIILLSPGRRLLPLPPATRLRRHRI